MNQKNIFLFALLTLLWPLSLWALLPPETLGTWAGPLEVKKIKEQSSFKSSMQFELRPLSPESYLFAIHYSVEPRARNYLLKTLPGKTDQYLLDEGNGILIDLFWQGGNRLASSFEVNSQTIENLWEWREQKLYVTFRFFQNSELTQVHHAVLSKISRP